MHKLCIFFTLLWIQVSFAAESHVVLSYLPNMPVIQTSDLKIKMNYALPGSKMDGEDQQQIRVQVTLLSDSNQPIIKPPVDLLFVLKNFSISLNANDLSEKFLSESPEKMPHQVQTYQIVDKKLKLHFDESGHIQKNTEEFQVLFSEYPALREMNFENFLADWFQHLFALAGKNLYVGAVFKIPGDGDYADQIITYEITEITPTEVHANFQGSLGGKNMRLTGRISLDGKTAGMPEMTILGETKGHVVWNRKNALLYQVQGVQGINGVLKIGDTAWTLGLQMNHFLDSKIDSTPHE
jgi:hypothetical protein